MSDQSLKGDKSHASTSAMTHLEAPLRNTLYHPLMLHNAKPISEVVKLP